MATSPSFRIGKVTVYLRGKVWYLRYHEGARRQQVRAGPDKAAARQLASQVNVQLETGTPVATSFEPVTIPELQNRWLEHHEHVLRSSMATINRYRTATGHLVHYCEKVQSTRHAGTFQATQAEAFVRYLRTLEVAPNGHKNAVKRRLRDKGLWYVLAVCRSMFAFALKRRHLPPYSENPFGAIDIDRMTIEDAKPVILFTSEQESQFLAACDGWMFPLFLTLTLTGLRPGELAHLLVEDLDLAGGWLLVRNKPELGWQVKTRNERKVPLSPELASILLQHIGGRRTGPVFLRRRFVAGDVPVVSGVDRPGLLQELSDRIASLEKEAERSLTRQERMKACHTLWVDMGAVREDRIREAFMRVTVAIGIPSSTAPKVLRHMFATALQDANVDPLIRNELMGHTPAQGGRRAGTSLGMTGVYTHTRDETLRRQLFAALEVRPAMAAARGWLAAHGQQARPAA
jgi:integrase